MNAPSFRLDRYDTLVLDEVIHIIVHRDSGSLTIAPGDGGPARTYANHELLELYYDRRLRIMRNAAYRLSPALIDRVSRPLDAFEPRHAAEALRRLEYVQACDQLFSRFRGDPRFTQRPETGWQAISPIRT